MNKRWLLRPDDSPFGLMTLPLGYKNIDHLLYRWLKLLITLTIGLLCVCVCVCA